MTGTFTFDDERHEYRLNDRVLPSVTGIIKSHVKGWQAADFYLQRGSAVHKAVALALDDRLDWESVDARIVGRVKAVLRFIESSQLKRIATEYRMFSETFQFAGTADFIGAYPDNQLVLVDYKSSVEPSVIIQLGLYAMLWNYAERPIYRGCAIETHDDGTYKAHWFTSRQLKDAANVGLAMLTVFGWRQKNNLLPNAESTGSSPVR